VAGDELNGRQYYDLKNTLSQLERDLKAVAADTSSIKETLDGKGRELGIKQEMRELKQQVEGRPPKYEDGIAYAINLLGTNHTNLRREFDEHVDTQEKESAGRTGQWKGAYTVYAIVAAAVIFLASAVGLWLTIAQVLRVGGQ
jgi:Flp pilus assembly protein TadB